MNLQISPAASIKGSLSVPGDKSISHRSLMLAALAEGQSKIHGLSEGADVKSTLACLRQLGAQVFADGERVLVNGRGHSGLRPAPSPLDAGNSGSTMRMLSGILAGQPFDTTITGDDSLCKRPMRRIIEPLGKMGCHIESTAAGTAPLTIHGGRLQGIDYTLPVASAQVKSCILFAGLSAEGQTSVTEPSLTRDHSERMLRWMGANLNQSHQTITIMPGALHGAEIIVPGDFSSAAFFIVAAILLRSSELILTGINHNPTRTALLDVLSRMGAAIEIIRSDDESNEPVADLRIRSSQLRGVEVPEELVPLLIDEVPILAIAASQAEGVTTIRGAKELRLKESDRIAAIANNLRAMGGKVEELTDGLIITGPAKLRAASLDSYGDHRIAMAFAVAALLADSPSTILNAECADISFPGFYELLRRHCA